MVRNDASDVQGWGPYGIVSEMNECEILGQNGNGKKVSMLVLVVLVEPAFYHPVMQEACL